MKNQRLELVSGKEQKSAFEWPLNWENQKYKRLDEVSFYNNNNIIANIQIKLEDNSQNNL